MKKIDCRAFHDEEARLIALPDKSGDIDLNEWIKNLEGLPKLKALLKEDMDPEWGLLKSYRTHEDQLAKNLAKILARCCPRSS